MGLSFEELNNLSCGDLIDLAKSFTGNDKKDEGPREATQADIDAFYGK